MIVVVGPVATMGIKMLTTIKEFIQKHRLGMEITLFLLGFVLGAWIL